MKTCPNCNNENVDYANNCTNCGYAFNQEVNNNQNNTTIKESNQEVMYPENSYQEQIPQNNNPYPEQIPQNNNPYPEQLPQNNNPYQNSNTQFNYNQQGLPQNKKSKAVGLILNILVVGLGYAYVGKWGEGIVLLVVYLLMFFLGFVLIFPFIIALALWVYSLIKTNEMIDKYNAGLPY